MSEVNRNETLKVILDRRSIRTYRPDQVTDLEIKTILDAGKYAASSMNSQPWHFTVVQNKDLLKRINVLGKEEMIKSDNAMIREVAAAANFSPFYHAPTLIVVTGNPSVFLIQDCTLAIGNMMLAAASIGVGSVWINSIALLLGGKNGPELLKQLKIPEGNSLGGAIALGYNASPHPAAPPRKEGSVTILE
jgi:nitroreductase